MTASSEPGGRFLTSAPPEEVIDQEQWAELDVRLERVRAEKEAALRDPGPSWKEWFYFDASKWWIGSGLLILDSWLVAFWFEVGSIPGLVLSVAAAIYLEFLLARYLWHRPSDDPALSSGAFRPTWFRPVRYGRWTPEGFRVRAGLSPETGEAPVHGEEFL